MSKEERRPETDIPRRIYASTIKRIDKHLEYRPRMLKKSKQMGTKKHVKGDFNKFLELLIDTYEHLLAAPAIYVLNGVIYEDATEARGEAIKISVKTKKPVKWPEVYIHIGEDEG